MNTLLVITTGRTDVQLVQGAERGEFNAEQCTALHDELERREGEWSIVDTPAAKAGSKVSELPSSSFQICTPKLDAVLEYLAEHKMDLTHALIFDTRRNDNPKLEDPRFAGAILEKRLHDLRETVVLRTTFVKDDERIEDRNDPRDALIRRAIVTCIDEAVRQAVTEFTPQRVVVAATGGVPAIATLVREVVLLHAVAGPAVEFVEIADGARAHPPARDRAVPLRSIPEPAESFRSRRHALDLIGRGNFLAAWGAVRHLHDDEIEQQWTRVVEWLYLFAASLPIPPECSIDVLRHKRMAVRAALRVEFALRAGDIPRAVHGTVAFFEAALWDHLLGRFTPHPTKPKLFKAEPPPNECLIRSDDNDQGRPFLRKEDGYFVIFDDKVGAIRLAERYLKNPHLTTLAKLVSEAPRDLRNDVDHNEPTPALMAKARKTMIEEGLWSQDGRFLTQRLTQNVLEGLGEQHPERLCEDLFAIVKSRLLTDNLQNKTSLERMSWTSDVR